MALAFLCETISSIQQETEGQRETERDREGLDAREGQQGERGTYSKIRARRFSCKIALFGSRKINPCVG